MALSEIVTRADVLLSLQKALLGVITLNMRAVTVCWTDKDINFRVIFSGQPSETDFLTVSEIETEVIADFAECICVSGIAEGSDPNQRIRWREEETVVFARAEGE